MWMIRVLLVAYGALAALAFFGQRKIMYPVPAGAIEPRIRGASLERLTRFGSPICASYVPALENRPTLVHFHGNGEQLADQAELVKNLSAQGLGVYAIEYPGYGLLRDAAANEKSLYDAAEAALRHLREDLGVPVSRTILQGQSLGTGVAVEMARRGHAARLILISPFTSMTDMGRKLLPWLPVAWLIRDRYDNAAKAPHVAVPTLVIHGTADEVIPVQMGRRVAELLPDAKLLHVEGGHHNDLFAYHTAAILTEIARFAALPS
jgi:uncharacterized protein